MLLDKLCMGCMQDRGEARICPHCGWIEGTLPQSPAHLPPRTFLNRRYCIGRVLGQGGFGITYLGWDTVLKTRVAIKEYMPQEMATRSTGEIELIAFQSQGRKDSYEYGRQKFLDEARTLAQMDDNPGIVAVRDYFEANNTAYLVMPFLDGTNFKDYLNRKGGRISFEDAMKIMMPVLASLQEVHAKGLLHRDVSPDNIFVTRSMQVKLLDFGAARYAMGDQSRSLSVILKPGYAPEEQYRSKGVQGPWTDEYAAAATFYRAITGQIPPEALDRLHGDSLEPPSKLGVKIPPQAEAALLKALSIQQQGRYQSINEFRQALLAGAGIYPSPASAGQGPAVSARSSAPAVPAGPAAPAAPLRPADLARQPSDGRRPDLEKGRPAPSSYPPPRPVDQRLIGRQQGSGPAPILQAPPGSLPAPGIYSPAAGYPPAAYSRGPGPAAPAAKKGRGLIITVFLLALIGLVIISWATGIVKINTGPKVARLDYPDGSSYNGEYDQELSYSGDYISGKFDGRGTYTWHHGDDYTIKYEGDFKKGMMEGSGTYYGRYGETYSGSFSAGLFNGSGKLSHEDGYVYRGGFVDGLPDGEGESTFEDGTVYQGEFAQGVMEGQGFLTWPDGSYYTGEFANDLPEGMGALYDENDVLLFQGPFVDGQPAAQ